MSTTDPLLATIEPDEVPPAENTPPTRTQTQRDQIVLTPTNHAQRNTSASDMEAGKLVISSDLSEHGSDMKFRSLRYTETGMILAANAVTKC